MVKLVEFLFLLQAKDNILGFEICMNDIAYPVEVVESNQGLPRYLTHYWYGYALVVILLYQRQQVLTQYLKGHNGVFSIEAMVEKLVEHLQIVSVLPTNFELGIFMVVFD